MEERYDGNQAILVASRGNFSIPANEKQEAKRENRKINLTLCLPAPRDKVGPDWGKGVEKLKQLMFGKMLSMCLRLVRAKTDCWFKSECVVWEWVWFKSENAVEKCVV